jgi:hypothetical protein
MEWPNRIWAASLDLKKKLDFLKHFVNMRFGISFDGVQIYKNLDLWIKSYGETKKNKEKSG